MYTPLSRLLAGLLVIYIQRNPDHALDNMLMWSMAKGPSGGSGGPPTLVSQLVGRLMERALRTIVLVSQVNASMWRRNGVSLVHQVFFYQNPQHREHFMDKDILLCKIGAAGIPADEYVVILLNRFGLLEWAQDEFDERVSNSSAQSNRLEESVRQQQHSLAEEFLYWMLVIVGERSIPGVGHGATRRHWLCNEVIHLLCIKPMSHGELVEALPPDADDDGDIDFGDTDALALLDDVLREVADYREPRGVAHGLYVLKAEFEARYNMFFYHFNRVQHSKAETSRRERLLSVRRKQKSDAPLPIGASGSDPVFPPPDPGRLAKPFRPISKLLSCSVMQRLLVKLLTRACSGNARSYTEGQLLRAIYFIGYALYDEQRALRQRLSTLAGDSIAEAGTADDCDFTENAPFGLDNLLQTLADTDDDSHMLKGYAAWALRFLRETVALRAELVTKKRVAVAGARVDADAHASLPKPSGANSDASASPSQTSDEQLEERQRRAELARSRRDRVMSQMRVQQAKFAMQHGKELERVTTASGTTGTLEGEPDDAMETESAEQQPMAEVDSEPSSPICCGARRTWHLSEGAPNSLHAGETFTCILCAEEQSIDVDWHGDGQVSTAAVKASKRSATASDDDESGEDSSDALVLISLVQRSTLQSHSYEQSSSSANKGQSIGNSVRRQLIPGHVDGGGSGHVSDAYRSYDRQHRFPIERNWLLAPHISTCGHVMHLRCWQKYFEQEFLRLRRQTMRARDRAAFATLDSYAMMRNEFKCPLCSRLSNAVIPLILPVAAIVPRLDSPTAASTTKNASPSLNDWLIAAMRHCADSDRNHLALDGGAPVELSESDETDEEDTDDDGQADGEEESGMPDLVGSNDDSPSLNAVSVDRQTGLEPMLDSVEAGSEPAVEVTGVAGQGVATSAQQRRERRQCRLLYRKYGSLYPQRRLAHIRTLSAGHTGDGDGAQTSTETLRSVSTEDGERNGALSASGDASSMGLLPARYAKACSQLKRQITQVLHDASRRSAVGLSAGRNEKEETTLTISAIAYSIEMIEIGMRVESKPLFGAFSSRQFESLRGLIGSLTWLNAKSRERAASRTLRSSERLAAQHAVRLLGHCLYPELSEARGTPDGWTLRTSSDAFGDSAPERSSTRTVKDFELFALLVSLTATVPYVSQTGRDGEQEAIGQTGSTGSIGEHMCLQLLVTLHAVQVMLSLPLDEFTNRRPPSDCTAGPDEYLSTWLLRIKQLQYVFTLFYVRFARPTLWESQQHKKGDHYVSSRLPQTVHFRVLRVHSVSPSLYVSDEYFTICTFYLLNRSGKFDLTTVQLGGHASITNRIHVGMLPFLRCAALLYHFVTQIEVPVALTCHFGTGNESSEFEALCRYLDLPIRVDGLLSTSACLRQLASR